MGSADTGKYCCPRCEVALFGHSVDTTAETPTDQDEPEAAEQPGGLLGGTGSDLPPIYDVWEMEQQLQHIKRVLAAGKPADSTRPPARPRKMAKVDSAHTQPAGWHCTPAGKSTRRRTAPGVAAESLLQLLTWAVVSLGLMALACGGVLLGWSMATDRQDLWTLGMPIALGGQIVLVVGLILQLDRIWHDSRDTAAKLDHVDERLHHLNTATMLHTRPRSPTAALYGDVLASATPQLLLADLKSQLDQLAAKIGQEVR